MGLGTHVDLTSFWSLPSFGRSGGGGGGTGLEFREYFATACPHCEHMDPVWKEAASNYSGPVAFKQIECADANWDPVPANAALCKGVHAFPTMKLYNNGNEVADFDGARTSSALVKFAKEHESVHTQGMPLLSSLVAAPQLPSRRREPTSAQMSSFL
mmetsp:Transcript_42546/g.97532  ORF Transcript_42546/g.97532 Transcript_42546/m.97532 type:complete len:157 (+) Transcript_42546:53-523(+)